MEDLTEAFVCVRMIQANGMDLSLFQFDYDMSFAVTFLNADRTVYGRYGSRSAKPEKAARDISLQGLAAAMEGALALHRAYPGNREALKDKAPKPTSLQRPEDLAELTKYEGGLTYENAVAQSCLHCHQISDEQRRLIRQKGDPMDDKTLFPWPMPDAIGISMDPEKRAIVQAVAEGSPASGAGLKAGDEILRVEGQPILSTADIQWVLHHAGPEDQLRFEVTRADEAEALSVRLEEGWRRKSDISWRVSTWDLRRMGLGGMVLVPLEEAERTRLGIPPDKMALKAEHVGQYGEHAIAKRAGVVKGDVITSIDGRDDPWIESQVLRHLMQNSKPGDEIAITLRRGDDERRATFRLP